MKTSYPDDLLFLVSCSSNQNPQNNIIKNTEGKHVSDTLQSIIFSYVTVVETGTFFYRRPDSSQ